MSFRGRQLFHALRKRIPHVFLQVKTRDESRGVGRISKQWSGLLKEIFTDTDNFGIQFPIDLDVKVKAILLGACFLIVSPAPELRKDDENWGGWSTFPTPPKKRRPPGTSAISLLLFAGFYVFREDGRSWTEDLRNEQLKSSQIRDSFPGSDLTEREGVYVGFLCVESMRICVFLWVCLGLTAMVALENFYVSKDWVSILVASVLRSCCGLALLHKTC